MKHKEWKYKIGQDKVAVVLMFLMSLVFGGLDIWLRKINIDAVFFVTIIAGLMTAVFLLTVHRFFFYKVLIGEEGFYYQTNIGNGKFYSYKQIEKVWISSGTAQNGGQHEYCNIAVTGQSVLRFQMFYQDKKAVKYLIKRVERLSCKTEEDSVCEKEEYLIDGKAFGKIQIGIGVVIIAVMVVLDVFLLKVIKNAPISIMSFIMILAMVWLLFNHYFFFQVKIQKAGFYCRTNLFDGHYYTYEEIVDYREIKKIVRHRLHYWNAAPRRYYFFFAFTDIQGKTRKFQFEQEIYEQEIRVLKERIEKAKASSPN